MLQELKRLSRALYVDIIQLLLSGAASQLDTTEPRAPWTRNERNANKQVEGGDFFHIADFPGHPKTTM